jgi:hypothetical protein
MICVENGLSMSSFFLFFFRWWGVKAKSSQVLDMFLKEFPIAPHLPIGNKLRIYAGFGFRDKIFAHSLANVKMTSMHKMKTSIWM